MGTVTGIGCRLRSARPARAVLVVAALSAVAAMAGALVADNVLDADGLTGFDRPVLAWMVAHRDPVATAVATAVTDAGGTISMAVLAAIVAAWLLWRGRRGSAVLVVLTAVGAAALVTLTKTLVGRVRPPVPLRLMTETSASFPSGHTLGSTAVIGVVTAVMVVAMHRGTGRIMLVTAAVTAVAAIGLSRLYLGVHWATDVLEGWLIGGVWLVLCLGAAMWWSARQAPPVAGAVPGTQP